MSRAGGILRQGSPDAVLVLFAFAHAAVLLVAPTLPVIAVLLWWNSNTVAHYFLHNPFFRLSRLNSLFGLYLSSLLGIPQAAWRDRHLAHHVGEIPQIQISPQLIAEVALIALLWGLLMALAPWFFLTVYVPGYLLGLGLCAVHGYYEHAGGGTQSHYGRLYNWLFFNDGYHVEHHARPQACWTDLPARVAQGTRSSRWPAVLRWFDLFDLNALERLVLRSRLLQRIVLAWHARALTALHIETLAVRRAAIVGGGLFPRSAILLRQLFPTAQLVIIDACIKHLDLARSFLPGDVEVVCDWYAPERHPGFDLVVIPLAYVGDRAQIYSCPPAPTTLVHDWLWRPYGDGRVVSWILLKRINLLRKDAS